MTDLQAIVGGRVVADHQVLDGHAILVRSDRIEALVPLSEVPDSCAAWDVGGRLVTAGLIDLHMHGALGASFGDDDPTTHATLMHYLLSQGVTSVQPTLSTTRPEVLDRQLSNLEARGVVCGGAQMLKVHLEGPFLAPDQRGAHPRELLEIPSSERVDDILEHLSIIGMVTLAPEIDGGLELVDRLVAERVKVAVGHSGASPDVFRAAVDRGASHLTHLWSGQSNVHRVGPWRTPGLVELSLASDSMTAEVIADGAHLPPELLEIARRCLPDRLCVVSDSTRGAGLPEGTRFDDGGVECEVRDSVCVVVGEDSFAGSVTSVSQMLARLCGTLGWPIHDAVAMATTAPARAAGLSDRKGTLAANHDADISVFDSSFSCYAAMTAGTWQYGPFAQGAN